MRVYIHIPFCASKCPYCAFGSVTSLDLIKQYFKALELDLKTQLQNLNAQKIKSVFIGGGTPSVVNAKFYEPIFMLLAPFLSKNAELTSEANPNSLNLKWLENMRAFGLNRISIGSQSFNEKKLKFLGRNHSPKDTFKAVEYAKIAGFTNINVDLMYASKLDDEKMLKSELENIKKLQISHISAYALSLEKNTPFFGHNEYKKDSTRLAKYLFSGLCGLGLRQYEISNFGRVCKHNLGYWRGDDYIGVGAFSVGTLGFRRFNAPRSLNAYIKNPNFKNIELLSKAQKDFERVFLGLRCILGVEKNIIKNKTNLKILLENAKLRQNKTRVYNDNFLLADELAWFLF